MAKIEQMPGGAVKGSKDKKSGKKTLRRIEIEPAKNGYTVEERWDSSSTGSDYPSYGPSNETSYVFEDVDGVLEHVRKCLGGKTTSSKADEPDEEDED